MNTAVVAEEPETGQFEKIAKRGQSGPWTDLGLTFPVFVGYHLGVVGLPVRNAADVVTRELVALADRNLLNYSALTIAIGLGYVGFFVLAGKGHAFRASRFVACAAEGVLYAVAMRLLAGYVVGRVFLGAIDMDAYTGFVMSLGAGFYEEIAFRVILYGLGAKLLAPFFSSAGTVRRGLFKFAWAVVAASVCSGWHYIGAMGDPFDARSFLFRAVCGLVFTAIYTFRGFAPAVWTHTLYDIWVLVL